MSPPRLAGVGGYTLPEMIVAASVLSLFIMLALGTIVPALKVTRQAEESLESQREVVLSFDRLVAEMSLLDRASLTVATDALGFLSDKPPADGNSSLPDADLDALGLSTPDRVWLKNVVLRKRAGHLWRREFPYTKGNELFAILSAKLAEVGDAAGVTEKIYAKNVELFEARPAGTSRVLLKIRSVFREGDKPAACELNLQIQMRGGN